MKKTLLALALTLMAMPSANAYRDVVSFEGSPKIVISINSQYINKIDYQALYEYLDIVSQYYSIYQGTYYIYINDGLPKSIQFPPRAAGGHIKGAIAYIDAKAFHDLNFDIYYGITHELAEMAVNPNLDRYYANGEPYEICDGTDTYWLTNGHWMSDFKKP